MAVLHLPKEKQDTQNIKPDPSALRETVRRTIVWPATLSVAGKEHRATIYDISLGGLRMKLDLPVEAGSQVRVNIKNQTLLNVEVVWYVDGFLGLKFTDPEDKVRTALSALSTVLEKNLNG